jgi:hypothetical protein
MTAIPKPAFERALAALSREEFVAFIAALWEARGYRTHRGSQPGVVVATHPHRADSVLYVPDIDGARRWNEQTIDAPAGFEERDITVVVPARDTPRPGDGVDDCVGTETVYELAMYAIDRDALADLCRSHFGRSPASLAAAGDSRDEMRPWQAVVTPSSGAGSRRRVAVLGTLALAVVLATALVWTGGVGLGSDTGAGASTHTTATPFVGTPLAATPASGDLERVCPDPPAGVSPGDLRPRTDTLDGWHVVDTHVVAIFDLMNRSQEAAPEKTFVGTYVGPDGRAYELRISRWADAATARAEAADRRARWPVWEVWGPYSFGVGAAPNGTAPSTSLTRAAARELLTAVDAPGGADLVTCVDDLVEDRG